MSDIKAKRPISPYLTIYNIFGNPGLTSNLSILNRITGMVNAAGLVFFTLWLVGAAFSVGSAEPSILYKITNGLFEGGWAILGYTGLFLWSICGFYHILDGIRYLIFDLGYGFEKKQIFKSGLTVLIALAVSVILVWLIVLVR
ncbi:MAG: succinate dehydrogenase, cytochrome b556 subunit [Alphaproteobacteria bacterium]